jgi:hypothetical protein
LIQIEFNHGLAPPCPMKSCYSLSRNSNYFNHRQGYGLEVRIKDYGLESKEQGSPEPSLSFIEQFLNQFLLRYLQIFCNIMQNVIQRAYLYRLMIWYGNFMLNLSVC